MDRKALHKLSYGLYIVSAQKEKRPNGQIANAVIQVASDPPLVAVSINHQNLTHEFIEAAQGFTISILAQETPMEFIGRFGFRSGRDIDKFEGINYRSGSTGLPIVLDHTVGWLELNLIDKLDVRTHTLFIGQVVDAEVLSDDPTLTYEHYHKVKKGRAPKTAPTYREIEIRHQKLEV
ncbi:flavin reductase [candidate division WOR-3 bacterium]|uniref:Flavin reductase n=1 Tax=candidate division WOR-3 bacterium TaxID=2052148 RepID=A0A660SLQ4_UNCW3|nr:MAG: flavin reductase [candidate division WOR-3 bacterium]